MSMGRTEAMLRAGFRLLVSLPCNDVERARAALEAGADALKVHINLEHFASGLSTGPLEQEAEALAAIVELGAPVGIVPGAGEKIATPAEMRRLDEIGIDFFDLYAQDMPAWMLAIEGSPMSVMVAFGVTCRPWALVERQARRSRPDLIEASIMSHESYGTQLTAADISEYAEIARRAPQPVIVPTQKAIRPDEVGMLADAGVAGLLIGAIVTGTEVATIARTTAQFRRAIDTLA